MMAFFYHVQSRRHANHTSGASNTGFAYFLLSGIENTIVCLVMACTVLCYTSDNVDNAGADY